MEHIHFRMAYNTHLLVRGITEVEINPQTKLQIILGTNGSGKSTILRELSPLAAQHSDYMRGSGGKYGTVTHRGSTFEYSSDFTGSKNHYKLVKDGDVIYEGHVADAYNGFVKEHLGITAEIHDICIGAKKLTGMLVNERRNFLTKLSPTDYSYAIDYYKRLTGAHKEVKNAISRMSGMLLREKDKAISETEAARLKQEMHELRTSKSDLMKVWSPIDRSVLSILEEIDRNDSAIVALSDRFMTSLRVFSNQQGFKDSREIVSKIAEASSRHQHHEDQREKFFNLVQISHEKLADAQRSAQTDINDINREITQIHREIDQIHGQVAIKGYPSATNAQQVLISVRTDLHPILSTLPVDKDNRYGHKELEKSRETMLDVSSRFNKNQATINQLNQMLEVYEHHRDQEHTVCPKCDHKWIKGFDSVRYEDTKTKRDNLAAVNAELEKQMDAIRTYIHETVDVLSQYEYVTKVLQSTYLALQPLWKHIVDTNAIRLNPNGVLLELQKASVDLEMLIKVEKHQERLKELEVAKEFAERAAGIDINAISRDNAYNEEQLLIHGREAFALKGHIRVLETVLREWDFQEQVGESLERLETTRAHLLSVAEEANKRELIASIMFNLDTDIQTREQMLTRIESQQAVITSLEAEIATLQVKERVMKRAVDALSPAEGLIAKGLTGFINHFIDQSNAIIEKVWLYPLEMNRVKISEEHGVDLDYNFPFTVDNHKAGKDVKFGSGAQKEIFDLAFMLLSMKKSGLDDYPIFLDEFSIKMDVAHRREAMRMIMDLLNTSNFSQIFIVSHYESSYSSLGSADIMVLCPDNLNIPPDLAVNVHSRVAKN